jgi:PAS domain S-box-containing protein
MAPNLAAAIIRNPLKVSPTTIIQEVVALMSGVRTLCPIDPDHTSGESLPPETLSSCVVVVLEDDHVVGILTERDVVSLSAQQRPLAQLAVGDVMAQPVITRRESDLPDLFGTIDLLKHHHIRHLPILDEDDRLIGIVTHESLRQQTRPIDLLRLRSTAEVMTTQVLTAAPGCSMLEIARLMADHRVSSVVIAETGGTAEAPLRRAVGLLTERDLVQFQALGLSLTATTAQAVMSSPVLTVSPEESLWTVQQIMEQQQIRRVIVAGTQGELLGIVTQTNLLQVFNPIELYQMAEVLEQKVIHLESERVALLQKQASELEWHITENNQAIKMQAEIDRFRHIFALASTHLVNVHDGQASVQAGLGALGSALDVDRVYTFEFHPHPQTGEWAASQRWEWVNEGVTPQIDNPALQDFPLAEKLPRWFSVLTQGQPIVGLIKDFAENEQAILAPQGIVSTLIVPILIQDRCWGFIGFDNCHHERVWESGIQSALQSMAGTIGSAIARQRAEANATDLATRLQAAQRIAHIGNWELNLQDNILYWSEEIFRIFEVDPHQFGASYEAFLGLVHPEDRPLIEAAYGKHLSDRQPYQLVHRLQMPDGRIKYVREQCETTYDAGGTPLFSQGTVQDITEQQEAELCRERAEAALRKVVEGTAAVMGEHFFSNLVRHLADALQVRYALVTELVGDHLHSLGFCVAGELQPPLSYAVAHTPCEKDLQDGEYLCGHSLQEVFPEDVDLVMMAVESYLGVALKNDRGESIGDLCVFDTQPMSPEQLDAARQILRVFADRASAELQRQKLLTQVYQLNQELEARVEQREIRYRSLMEYAPDAILLANTDGFIVEANRKAEDLLGYALPELTTLHFTQLHPPAELPKVRALFAAITANQLTQATDILFLRRDGTTVPVDLTASIIQLPHEVLIQGVFRDVSQRQVMEQNLRDSEAKYRQIIEVSQEGIWLIDAQGNHQWGNAALLTMLGRTAEDMTGRSLLDFVAPELHPHIQELLARRKSGIAEVNEVPLLRKDGTVLWTLASATPLFDPAGKYTGALAMVADITDRKLAEATLQSKNTFLDSLLENLSEGLCVCQACPDYPFVQFTVWNPQMQVITGYTQTDINELGWYQTLYPNPELQARAKARMESMRQGENILGEEWPIRHRDGSERIVSINTSLLPARDGQPSILAVMQDITARKRVEQELQLQWAAIEAAADGIAVLQAERYLYLNSAHVEMFGYGNAEELVGQNWRVLYSPEELERLDRDVFPVLLAQKSWQGEVTATRKDGTTFPERLSLTITPDNLLICVCQDISENARLEADRQALLRELANFKQGLDEAAIVAITDARGIINYANQRFVEISGYSEAELMGQTHRLVKSGYHPQSFYEDLWQTIRQGQIWRGTICNRAKGGRLYWVDSTILPFMNAAGGPDRYLAIRFDITEQVQSQQLLQQNNQLLQGITQSQSQFITAQNRHDIYENLLSVLLELTNSEYGFIGEVLFREDDGQAMMQESFLKIRGVPYLKTHSITNIAWDEATQKLYDDNYEMGMEFSNLNTLFGAVIVTGQPVIANSPSTDPRRGGTPKGHPPLNAFMGLPIWNGDTLIGMIGVANRPNGYTLDLVQSLNPLLVTCSTLIEGYRENYRRQQAEESLKASLLELARATRLKDEFLANMSHELRTPLNAILGMSEGLQDQVFGPITPEQSKALLTIEHSGTHLLALINDVLDVAKIESGQIELDLGPIAIGALCHTCLDFIKQMALKKHISLHIDVPLQLPDVHGDERRLRQVLINLLTNAVKFTPDGGIVTLAAGIPAPVNLDSDQSQNSGSVSILAAPWDPLFAPASTPLSGIPPMIRIAITDTGIGIAPEHMPKLFQPFVQIDSALNRQYTGTGLGLALVKRLVKLHGGQVSLGSVVGLGSCFAIDLPCGAEVCVVEGSLEGPQPALPAPPLSSPLILLAEDNEANTTTICSYLRAKGFQIIVAKDGGEAITLTQTSCPDLILMDIQMPKVDGLQAIQTIRQDPRFQSTPIIALTALAMTEDQERCLAAGATDYMAKPVKLKALVNRIQDLMSQYTLQSVTTGQ